MGLLAGAVSLIAQTTIAIAPPIRRIMPLRGCCHPLAVVISPKKHYRKDSRGSDKASVSTTGNFRKRLSFLHRRSLETQCNSDLIPWRDNIEPGCYHDFVSSRPWHSIDDFYAKLIRGNPEAVDLGFLAKPNFPTDKPRPKNKQTKAMYYVLGIAYDGSAYESFALNRKIDSVVGRIKTQMRACFGKSWQIMVSGRTDRGVHGWGQILSFKTPDDLDLDALAKAIYADSDGKIRVWNSARFFRSFSAWSDTKWREYVYLFPLTDTEVERKHQICGSAQKLFDTVLNKSLSYDAFARRVKQRPDPDGKDLCTLYEAEVSAVDLGGGTTAIRIRLRGNRFLR